MMVLYDPRSYEEELREPTWKSSMKYYFKSLQDNESWDLVPLPSKRKLMQCKWVYRTKVAADGSDINYKASLVAKLFSQFQGVDYTDTFTQVAKMD